MNEPLIMWTVYYGCTDMPPHVWRIRKFEITSEGAVATQTSYDLFSFEAIRERWEDRMGLYWQPRHERRAQRPAQIPRAV